MQKRASYICYIQYELPLYTAVRVNSGLWVNIPIKFYGTVVFSSGELMLIVAKKELYVYFKPKKKEQYLTFVEIGYLFIKGTVVNRTNI